MAAYVIADVEVTDPELFAEYRELVEPTVNAFGGRYLARGGDTLLVEGDRSPNRTVIIEFDSMGTGQGMARLQRVRSGQGYAISLRQLPRHHRRGFVSSLEFPNCAKYSLVRTVSIRPVALSREGRTQTRTVAREVLASPRRVRQLPPAH